MGATEFNKHYLLTGSLRSGAAADLLLAEHSMLGSRCAIKRFINQGDSIENALKEAAIIQGIKHPNIIYCLEIFFRNQLELFLVTEYSEGGSLRDLICKKGKFTLLDACECVRQILSGISVLHQLNIVHCDLKPENILTQSDKGLPLYKIADFDVAVILNEASEREIYATGSPSYMAPERFTDSLSLQSDLYSVGILFYELLVGERPFKGSVAEIMMQHQQTLPDLEQIKNTRIRAVIRKLLEKNCLNRYATADEVLKAIDQTDTWSLESNQTKTSEPTTERVVRRQGYSLYQPATKENLDEIGEFAIKCSPNKVHLFHCEDRPLLALEQDRTIWIHDGTTGAVQASKPGWMPSRIQPLSPQAIAYAKRNAIYRFDPFNLYEEPLFADINPITGFAYHEPTEELAWTDSRTAYYRDLKTKHNFTSPCLNFGLVPCIRFTAGGDILYSSGPSASALNRFSHSGMLVDKIWTAGPVLHTSNGLDNLLFLTHSLQHSSTLFFYQYSEAQGLSRAAIDHPILSYATCSHYFVTLLDGNTLRTYFTPGQFSEIHFEGPKHQAVITSLDNRFIYLLRRKGNDLIFCAYRNGRGTAHAPFLGDSFLLESK